uniref:Inter-alpha-trypsin inhibitor heavy chain family member 6 n=1 Tax=Rousettus aegyptiacus TaxID=9407 RepID=A0A7J8EKG1_ROUAE|nr:inter-alpha-trypsin inhibitor heavy chain family member 6 [Rousettus aegyptiacus]
MPLTSLVITLPKEASEESRRQTSTTIAPGTIITSSTTRHGLGTGTAQPGLVPKVSLKSKLVKPNFYLFSTSPASTKKRASSKELEPPGQSPSTLSTPSHPRPKISAQHNSGTLAQPINSQDKTCFSCALKFRSPFASEAQHSNTSES